MNPNKPAKRKNVEKRREKSRTAARCRRSRESDIFTDLYDVVPLVQEPTVSHVDRIAILRLAASLCRIRQLAPRLLDQVISDDELREGNENASNAVDCQFVWTEQSLAQCLEGFLLVADSNDIILYISEGVSSTLGLTQTDINGQSIDDFLHSEDLAEFKARVVAMLERQDRVQMGGEGGEGTSSGATASEEEASERGNRMILRIKSVISPRGRNLNLKSATYKAVTFTVKVIRGDLEVKGREGKNKIGDCLYVLHGIPVQTAAQQQAQDGALSGVFMTRHTSDMKFSYSHERITDYLGYDVKSLMGSSFYALVHPEDLKPLADTLKELFKKGQCRTGYYRLLARSGGIIWVQTEATTLTHSTRGQRGQYVVCMHSVIGSFRGDGQLLSDVQLGTWEGGGCRGSKSGGGGLYGPHTGDQSPGISGKVRGRLAGALARSTSSEKKTKRQRIDEVMSERAPVVSTEAIRIRGGDENDEGDGERRRKFGTAQISFGNPYAFDIDRGPESIRRWLLGEYSPQMADSADPKVGQHLFPTDPSGPFNTGIRRAGSTCSAEKRNPEETAIFAGVAGGLSNLDRGEPDQLETGLKKDNCHQGPADGQLAPKTFGTCDHGTADKLAALSLGARLQSRSFSDSGGGRREPAVVNGVGGKTYATLSTSAEIGRRKSGDSAAEDNLSLAVLPAFSPRSEPGSAESLSSAVPSSGGATPEFRGGGLGSVFSPLFTPDTHTPSTTTTPVNINRQQDSESNTTSTTNSKDVEKFTHRTQSSERLNSASRSSVASLGSMEEVDLSGFCPFGSEMLAPFVSSEELFDLDAMAIPLHLDFEDTHINLEEFSDEKKAEPAVPLNINAPVSITVTNAKEEGHEQVSPSIFMKKEPETSTSASLKANKSEFLSPPPNALAKGLLFPTPSSVFPMPDLTHPPDPGGPSHSKASTLSPTARLHHFGPPGGWAARPELTNGANGCWEPPPPIRVGREPPSQPQKSWVSRSGYEAVMAYMQPHIDTYAHQGIMAQPPFPGQRWMSSGGFLPQGPGPLQHQHKEALLGGWNSGGGNS